MIDNIFIAIAMVIGAAGGGGPVETAPPAADVAVAQPSGETGGGGLLAGTDEMQPATADTAGGDYVAEPQVPTGQFTTATEIKPIMNATKGNWVAVREYDGRDLVYFTLILSWRCGLVGVRYAINDGPMRDWPLAPCQTETNAPNAIPDDAQIYEVHPLKSVSSLSVEVIYDDLTRDSARFERKQVLMP